MRDCVVMGLSFISSIHTKQIHYAMYYSMCKQGKSQDRMTECIIGRKTTKTKKQKEIFPSYDSVTQ